MTSIDAFILVGGRSSRMGRDKATVVFRGLRMVDSVAEAIRSALPNARISIVAANNDQLAEIGEVANADGYIVDSKPDIGPVGGLRTAVANSDADWIFVAACDMPLISAEFIAFLVEQIDANCDVVLPIQPDGRPQPLAALYRIESVRDQLSVPRGDDVRSPSMRAVITPLRVVEVNYEEYAHLEDSRRLLTNVNSPNDVQTTYQISTD